MVLCGQGVETRTPMPIPEPEVRGDIDDPNAQTKPRALARWRGHASGRACTDSGKPWCHALIPHDAMGSGATEAGLADRYRVGMAFE